MSICRWSSINSDVWSSSIGKSQNFSDLGGTNVGSDSYILSVLGGTNVGSESHNLSGFGGITAGLNGFCGGLSRGSEWFDFPKWSWSL